MCWIVQVLEVLSSAREYDEVPVRHNEDKLNTTLCGLVRFPPDVSTADDPHTKANLLLQVLSSASSCWSQTIHPLLPFKGVLLVLQA